MMHIGQAVKTAIDWENLRRSPENKLTLAGVAKAAGISRNHFYALLKKRDIEAKTLRAIAKGIGLDELTIYKLAGMALCWPE